VPEKAKAQRAVDGHAPVKRNRYIQLTGATKSVNRTLEAKTRALAGWKGYTANLVDQPASFVIDAYHQLWRIEGVPDVQARPAGAIQPSAVEREASPPVRRTPAPRSCR
jgi:hypothetical protein